MKCKLVEQGFKIGDCLIHKGNETKKACDLTIKRVNNVWFRLIKSAHLSRPEHYFSIYQSGCNHSCLKCHSWEFTQIANGKWISTKEIGLMAKKYENEVTVFESRERVTMWHGTDLCRSCGSCVIYGERSSLCPGILDSSKIVLSPQGFGPARNIVAFTGGDVLCCIDFYCQAIQEIKKNCRKMWVLIETNGYALVPENLDKLRDAGVDSFWLDIKAYDERIYKKLCGTTNEWILKAPYEILKRDFILEVLTLFIPGWVEDEQIIKILKLLVELNPEIPFTILAFFPSYKMKNVKPPTLFDMIRVYKEVKDIGLKNVKLGNYGVFVKTERHWKILLEEVGLKGIG